MSCRYKINLSYKGTHYFGWQIQPNQISVQEKIVSCLTKLNHNQVVELTGCGRTDTGVHAKNYIAHFDIEHVIDTEQWMFKLNTMLPADIAIHEIVETTSEFHARFDAKKRTYEYHIHTSKNPFIAETSWFYKLHLDLNKLKGACEIIKERQDFECFSKVKTDVTNFNCTIYDISFTKTEQGYLFEVTANRFLRNMVRAIVGTLIEVGTDKISLEDLKQILDSKNRSNAGVSVPAQGLTLVNVTY